MTATKPEGKLVEHWALRRSRLKSNQRTTTACSKPTSLRKVPERSSGTELPSYFSNRDPRSLRIETWMRGD
jgi:SMC interacting uncharacterized protein involved in chromosome segregation